MIRFPIDNPHAGMLTELVRAGRVQRADLDATSEADKRTISAEYAQMRIDSILRESMGPVRIVADPDARLDQILHNAA